MYGVLIDYHNGVWRRAGGGGPGHPGPTPGL